MLTFKSNLPTKKYALSAIPFEKESWQHLIEKIPALRKNLASIQQLSMDTISIGVQEQVGRFPILFKSTLEIFLDVKVAR